MTSVDGVPLLTDGTVTLRPHHVDDVPAIVEQCRDLDMRRYTTVPDPYARADAEAFVAARAQAWASGTKASFAVEAPSGAGPTRFAGSIGLHAITAEGQAEIDFGAHPAARGRGVTTAAVSLLLDWAFEDQGLRRIGWSCVAGNLASWRVAWRNGFRFDGPRRRLQAQRGELQDAWTGSLLSSDTREPKNRWLACPTLADEHIVLRGLRAEDEDRSLETANDPETRRWLHEIPFPRDAITFRERLASHGLGPALGRAVEYTMADPTTDAFVGSMLVFGFGGLDHLSAEVGYRTHPDARGRGRTSAALRLLTDLAFTPESAGGYGLERLHLGAGDDNAGSQAVARSCGFTETGRDRRCYLLADGTVHDLVRFDLLASEWQRPTPRGSAAR